MKIPSTLNECIRNVAEKQILLPSIQRGFVWKPYQIENLWDSLLRHYPIGAFTIQKKGEKIYILDGQQRITAFALGCGLDNVLNAQENEYKIFIDLYKPNIENDEDGDTKEKNDRLYNMRVISKYHPWGYSFKENEKTLEMKHIRKALMHFGRAIEETEEINFENPYKGNISNTDYPYDAYFPVPLSCFIKSESGEISIYQASTVVSNIKAWISNLDNSVQDSFSSTLNSILENSKSPFSSELVAIAQKFVAIDKGDTNKTEQKKEKAEVKKESLEKKPTLCLRQYFNENINLENEGDSENIEFYKIDEICKTLENSLILPISFLEISASLGQEKKDESDVSLIFERLNRGGTPISLEELNYSLFKSQLGNDYAKKNSSF